MLVGSCGSVILLLPFFFFLWRVCFKLLVIRSGFVSPYDCLFRLPVVLGVCQFYVCFGPLLGACSLYFSPSVGICVEPMAVF